MQRSFVTLMAAALGLISITPSAQAQISTTTWYQVIARHSNKCVDASGAGTANGTAVQQWLCNNTLAQQWQFQATSGGYYRVNTRNNVAQSWDVSGVSTADGALIQLWAYGGGNNQQWLPVAETGGFYHFTARHDAKCLDVVGGTAATGDGVRLEQWTCTGALNQSFSLVPAGGATPTATPTAPPGGTATATATSTTAPRATPTTPSTTGLSLLHSSGRNVVNASGQVVRLRGVNLGGWLLMEKWMCPMDSGALVDHYSVLQTLNSRFGEATQESLTRTYQQNWITTGDLDNIRAAGLNAVRVPVWWPNFYKLNNTTTSGWRSDAFEMLDWLVSNAGSRGLYVIIDMHGVVGQQSNADTTGRVNVNQYWSSATNQAQTAYIWQQIASHYRNNGTVAMYDLINEPIGTPSGGALWTIYNNLYNTIRAADPNHIITMEGAYGSWNWSMLPPPSQYGWTNVVYQMHEYQFGDPSAAGVQTGAQNQVNDFNNHSSWNVPGFIGEFNNFGTGSSVWSGILNLYTNNNLSWTMWSYKATHGLVPDSWGLYDPTFWPVTPNISTDTSATISNDWIQWRTTTSFGKNTTIGL
jgi:endoglucanase